MAEASNSVENALQSEDTTTEEEEGETVSFRVIWKKNNYDVTFGLDKKAAQLKEHIQTLTGLVKDEKTLRELKVTAGAKMMVVGSTIDDVMTVQPPSAKELKQIQSEVVGPPKEPLSEAKEHKKLIEKGKPEDVPAGFRHRREPLPSQPLSGMINKHGAKVRLYFKAELEQLWIGTKERTDKIPIGSIKKVLSEPIKGHEEYHIMALQLGPTELSRYWIYWVPAQYTEAIKDAILGKWQFF